MMLRASQRSFVPIDASEYVKGVATTFLEKRGGDGAVREMIEMLIKDENLEEQYLALWY